jgi:hypothetical protein
VTNVSDFTYTVFVIVASLTGFLITLFTAGVIGVILYEMHAHPQQQAGEARLSSDDMARAA